MEFIFAGVIVSLLGGLVALFCSPDRAARTGSLGIIAGALLAAPPVFCVLAGRAVPELTLLWAMPGGSLCVGLDGLSALFLLAVLVVAVLCAVYGPAYLRQHPVDAPGRHWFFLSVLVAGMVMVLVARNAMLFLIAWEVMSLAPLFLIAADGEGTQRAAWTYMVATHLGAVCLMAAFIVLGISGGGMDFTDLVAGASPGVRNAVFILALLGFGAKAGIVPLHVWLPEAHPEAPSHVSACMSGVMIKMGVYGLLRMLVLLGAPSVWWAGLLIVLGLVTAFSGILFALVQHNLKRLLAYCSVENVGLIVTGMGLGLLGICRGEYGVAVLGLAGALLHVLNHALYKSQLFLGAGAVQAATGTLDLNRLGGLLGRMPVSGAAFVAGSASICGLPPFNGFVSEFLIYMAAFVGLIRLEADSLLLIAVVAVLPLTGGLAAACFTKAAGLAFLGEPRTSEAAEAREVAPGMLAPLVSAAALCLVIGLAAPWTLEVLRPALALFISPELVGAELARAAVPLKGIVTASLVLTGILCLVALWRRLRLKKTGVSRSGTWSCGYAEPTARMQYSASSYVQSVAWFFRPLLRTRVSSGEGNLTLSSETPDVCTRFFYAPLFGGVRRLLGCLAWIQHGRVHLYVLYVVIALVVSLILLLGGMPL